MSEGIDKERYKIKQTPTPIMELLYEKGERGLSITIQDTNLLKLCKIEELNTIYRSMAIQEIDASDVKENQENKNLKAYNKEGQKYKSGAVYQEENSNAITRIEVGKLDKINAYGV